MDQGVMEGLLWMFWDVDGYRLSIWDIDLLLQ